MMQVEIINIGDEILIGQIVNTNAAWMAEKLNLAGFKVIRTTVIPDSREHILNALKEAESRAEIILISGGLGPTKDDITKKCLSEYFNSPLAFSEEAYKHVEHLFSRRGWTVNAVNRAQAEVPEAAKILPNPLGTACGMLFQKDKHLFVSMPGVPFEMQGLMEDHIIPFLSKEMQSQQIYHKTVLTQGIGESHLAEIINKWEEALPPQIKLAYLPQPGIVRLRLSATGSADEDLQSLVTNEISKLTEYIGDLIFGMDDDKLEEIVGKLLRQNARTLSTAESCSGGYIAHLITSVAGSSAYYKGSAITYSNDIKESILNVKSQTLEQAGAVSEEVVVEMVQACKQKFSTDYAISVSGIAGPDGGTADKPVGTIWMAIAGPNELVTKKYIFSEHRGRNIRLTAVFALNQLRKMILRDTGTSLK